MVAGAERCIPSRVDPAEVFSSPHLIGCYGLRPTAQTMDYTCGAAAAATVLNWYGIHANEWICSEAMGTNRAVGTAWHKIVRYLQRRGLNSHAYCSMDVSALEERAARQQPTIVEWLDWGGHWVVHVGFEPRLGVQVFADPARPRSRFVCHDTETFKRYWYGGGTGTMPITAGVGITAKEYRKGAMRQERNHERLCMHDWVTRQRVMSETKGG